jgi:pimeloyl-ACP methyl ester carboxylesterase
MRRIRTALSVLAVLTCALVAPYVAAASPKWTPCARGVGPFQCAAVKVPLDYANPHGKKIPIALVRLPATDQAHRIGSLFLNPGGPGGSGVEFVVGIGQELFTPEVRARFDLIGFDPRGIAHSNQLRCFNSQKRWMFTPFPFPTTPAEESAWMAADLYLDAKCAANAGPIASHMSTANVARDLDVLRAAVGDASLSYVGWSYGSYLGVTYANLFPERVRALVVDGVLNPVEWATGTRADAGLPFSTRLGSHLGTQATLDEFFRLCDAGGPNCAFAPDSAARYAALAARLQAHPLVGTNPDGSTFEYGYSNLIADTLGAMYGSAEWEDFAGFLAFLDSASSGVRLQQGLPSFGRSAAYAPQLPFPRLPRYVNFLEGFPGVACTDTDNPDSYGAWHDAAAGTAGQGYFGPLWTWITSICARWPFQDAGRYTGPFTATTANPILVIGNDYDPATPYFGAQAVAAMMPGARLLTVHGWGHTSLFLSACVDEVQTRYLVDLQLPPAGAECSQDHVPFSGP